MKLLFDHNLSPRLVTRLADLCPKSSHLSLIGLDRAMDYDVWEFARKNDYIIVTKDADFGDLSILYGFPPKVLWLRLGNCTTAQVETLIRSQVKIIADFADDPSASVLTLL
jgi:predicted nuclease of predicted toxin-antitoxin system